MRKDNLVEIQLKTTSKAAKLISKGLKEKQLRRKQKAKTLESQTGPTKLLPTSSWNC